MCCNTVSIWRVYIINEGVGKALRCQGFHNITINRNSTLSIINCSNQVSVATWDRDKIRRCGCLDSLVFIEAGRRCHGGAGMLWMYCPQFSAHFGDCLHRSESACEKYDEYVYRKHVCGKGEFCGDKLSLGIGTTNDIIKVYAYHLSLTFHNR